MVLLGWEGGGGGIKVVCVGGGVLLNNLYNCILDKEKKLLLTKTGM